MSEAGAAICLVTYGTAKWASFVLTFCSPTLLTHSQWAGRQTRPTPPLPTSVTTTEMHVGKKLAEYPRVVSFFLAESSESWLGKYSALLKSAFKNLLCHSNLKNQKP